MVHFIQLMVDESHFSGQLSIAGIKFAGMYSPMHSSNKVHFSLTLPLPILSKFCFHVLGLIHFHGFR